MKILKLAQDAVCEVFFILTESLAIFTFPVMGMEMSCNNSWIKVDTVTNFIYLGDAHKTIDLSHVIHEMWFGEKKGKYSDTLKEFQSHK